MKRKGDRESNNVEDHHGGSGGRGLGCLVGGRSIGIGTIVVAPIGGLDVWWFWRRTCLASSSTRPSQLPPVDDRMGKFVSTVLADTEDVWKELFTKGDSTYKELRLVLFRNQTSSESCGAGQAAVGPFYCPADQKIHTNLALHETPAKRLSTPGDDALAPSSGGAVASKSFTNGSSA